jgi:hypothetical protein
LPVAKLFSEEYAASRATGGAIFAQENESADLRRTGDLAT